MVSFFEADFLGGAVDVDATAFNGDVIASGFEASGGVALANTG
jgi:hypothetical protein